MLIINIEDLEAWCKIDFEGYGSNPMNYATDPHLCIIDKNTNKDVRRVPAGEIYPITYPGEIIDLEIPASITEIKKNAFIGGNNIESVTLSNVKTIGENAFAGCWGMKSLTLSDVNKVGKQAFNNCIKLETVNIKDLSAWCNIEFMDRESNPLQYAGKLNGEPVIDLDIPSGVKKINDYAFYGCSSIKTLSLPNSLESIGSSSFSNCDGLEWVILPQYLTSIVTDAFSGCANLKKAAYPSVFSNPFPSSVKAVSYPTTANIDGYHNVITSSDKSVIYFAPLSLKNLYEISREVTQIGDYAFAYCSNLTMIEIPRSVKTIGSYAFTGCNGLSSVHIPLDVESIGNGAFSYCSELKTVVYEPVSCNECQYGFNGSPVENLIIGPSVQKIPDYSFAGLDQLSELHFPRNISEIGREVWTKNCVKKITILGPTKVGSNDFSGVDLTLNNDCIFLKDFPYRNFIYTDSYTKCASKRVRIGAKSNLHVVDSEGKPTDLKCTSDLNESNWSWDGKEMNFWRLAPGTNTLIYAFGTPIYDDTTSKVSCSFKDEKYADLIKVTAEWDSGDYPITEAYWWDFYYYKTTISKTKTATLSYEEYKQTPEVRFYLSGNDPDYLSYSNSYDYTVSFPSVEISNESAQATSYTSARLSAEMNVSTGSVAGIEWRRNDAPENVKSNRVEAPVVGGRLMGELRGLRDDVYYKFRPFYNRDGVEFYGEWTGFYTGDAGVYFDPEVGTLPAIVGQTTVTMSGYVVAGSDNVTDRGFEYRLDSPASRAGDWQRISSTGTYMTSTAEGLTPATTYVYRAYAEASGKTYYGAEVSFTTEDTSGIEDVVAVDADGDGLAVALRENPVVDRPAVRVDAAGAETAECRIIGMNGNLVYSGTVAVTGDFETLEVSLGRGFYILYVSAGGHTKAVKMIVR